MTERLTEFVTGTEIIQLGTCRVYWGSHGCCFERNHEGTCECDCCECEDHEREHKEEGCVAKFPYYGPDTNFYGEDAAARGLRLHPES